MKTLELNLLATLALATALFFIGQLIVQRSTLLQRYSIPVPVVGGVLFALLLAVVGLIADLQVTMDDSPGIHCCSPFSPRSGSVPTSAHWRGVAGSWSSWSGCSSR